MKLIKRVIALAAAVIMLIPLVACSASDIKGASDYFNMFPKNNGYAADAEKSLTDPSYKEDNDSGMPMQEQNDNETVFIENEFISAAQNPVSTFSADVDTASYAYFRKLVNSGYSLSDLINYAGKSIRTEEMINYFKYSYNGPRPGELFGINTLISECPWNEEVLLMTLGLKTETAVHETSNNLVFLIDVSGSMNSKDKLTLLKTAFTYLTEQLTENDIISIVTYSGKEEVVLEGCEGHLTDRILSAVNRLMASGSTNGEAGIQRAYKIASDYFIEGGNNRIILASDGDLNVGISSPMQLKEFISEKRDTGIYLSVLGFGTGNYRDTTMEALAQNGNGVYYYIDSEAEAEKVFGEDLSGTLYTVGTDVKLQLTFDPAYIEEYRLVGYENRLLAKEDFNDDTKDAGDVGSGHSFTVCYEIKLTAAGRDSIKSSLSSAAQWMTLAVRYKPSGGSASLLNEYTIGSADYGAPDDDFIFICALTEISMILHKSKFIGDIDLDSILNKLNSLDLSADSYKEEFRSIVRALAK